jgi:glycosyltransferase involved in cell wall biosynthesis
MRILYAHQYFSGRGGALGDRSYAFAHALRARGHDVTVVCASSTRSQTGLTEPFKNGRREGAVEGIHVIEFDLAYSNSDGIAARAWKFIRYALQSMSVAVTRKFDLVFATSTPLSASLPGIAAKLLRGRPFVFEVRDLWPEIPVAMGMTNPVLVAGMGVLEWISYKMADRCVALAPGIADGIARHSIARDKIAMIPNGSDFDLFGQATPKRPPGVNEGEFCAIFAGAHGKANGLDAVVDAARVLKRRGAARIKLVLIGEGSEKPRLQQIAAAEQLDNLVFADPVSRKEVTSLLKGADLGLQILANIPAFYHGTSPNKFFDYLAAGLPVLINYPGWLAGLIGEHNAGYVAPPGDAEAFADALEAAAANPGERAHRGANASALGRAQFDRANAAPAFVAWIEAAVPNKARITSSVPGAAQG